MPSGVSLRLAMLAAATAAAGADCPSEEWHQFRDKCYWVSDFTLNARSVATICDSMWPGAEPVSIHDLDLDAVIAENLLQGQRAWLGLHRADTHAEWTWADRSDMNFTMWHEGQPNASGEICGTINFDKTGFWSDDPCDTFYLLFVCQIDA